ncbi:ferredoxin--NADP reductase [Mycolicibacillus parakoreensis]|uniref:Ferredoxin--NADP reductase n=1 Tax=Mycolicibacillus parakoreensis TaxID=1069221 RepID=A0ABY3U139_9MYCO|nr:ferredoxin--NADP reductase [Mycolicibacillus parakoreensis]MCV7317146.1 ferredoxin--NADP reductase [Mycolicibacillus parakoreensis]ULN51466.1 ferredoxin--NADP reductase [Mycolicibacillus parakoreensis]
MKNTKAKGVGTLGPHVFQPVTVTRVIDETPDARTFVLAPREPFDYRAGQYCTFEVRIGDETLYRSYSMSSAPETDTEVMTTVKRVAGGRVSNWMLDNVAEGDELTMTRAAGTFCLDETAAPLLGFAGGSGITPILSLAKSALASTDRRVRLLCADRDRESAIFTAALDDLVARYPGRLVVQRHCDADAGLLDAAAIREFVGDDVGADCYLCGPEGFMSTVRAALPGCSRVLAEDFNPAPAETEPPAPAADSELVGGTVTIRLARRKTSVPRVDGETLLETARRAGLAPPFSCEAGNCGTCMAHVTAGHATMRVNDALRPDEVEEGFVLTCQAIPDTPDITVKYE